MIDSSQFDALKRTLALRLLTKIPDEALGELLYAMREIIDHYGSLDEESFETTITRCGIVSLRQMRELLAQIDVPQERQEPVADPQETQDAPIVPLMLEEEFEEITRPVHRPPAISTRETFRIWLEEQEQV